MSKIQTITRKKISTEMLYDLSVEIDESYIANGIVVHNCRSIWDYNYEDVELKWKQPSDSAMSSISLSEGCCPQDDELLRYKKLFTI